MIDDPRAGRPTRQRRCPVTTNRPVTDSAPNAPAIVAAVAAANATRR